MVTVRSASVPLMLIFWSGTRVVFAEVADRVRFLVRVSTSPIVKEKVASVSSFMTVPPEGSDTVGLSFTGLTSRENVFVVIPPS